MRSFTVTATNGAALLTPIGVEVGAFSGSPPPADPDPSLTPARVIVSISNTTNSGMVTVGVSEGFSDTTGNVMGTAFSLPLLK